MNAIILYLRQNFRMTREQLIEKNKALFWYTLEAEKQNISDALLVETFLNYGTFNPPSEETIKKSLTAIAVQGV